MATPNQTELYPMPIKQSLAENKKNLTLFGLLAIGVALLFANVSLLAPSPLMKVSQIAGFLCLGYWHLTNLQRKSDTLTSSAQSFYTTLLAVVILMAVTALLIYRDAFWLLMAAASALSFLLPYLLFRSWLLYNSFPAADHPVWQFKEDSIAKQSVVSFNNIPIRLKFLAKQDAANETVVAFSAPIRMKLGTVFYHVIQQQNEGGRKVDHTDESAQPFFWEFYEERMAGWSKRYLNPDESLVENDVKPNRFIVIRRVAEPMPPASIEFRNEPVNI